MVDSLLQPPPRATLVASTDESDATVEGSTPIEPPGESSSTIEAGTPAGNTCGQTDTSDDCLPAKQRKLAPSRVLAAATYDWAMSAITGAEVMTIAELFEAIDSHPYGVDLQIGPNAETFARYLRDAGVKRYFGKTAKEPGGSVASSDDL